MSQPALEVFRLVALRGPDTTRTNNPVERVRRSRGIDRVHAVAAKLAENDWTPTNETESDLRALPEPYLVDKLRDKLPWFPTAEAFAADTNMDLSAVELTLDDEQPLGLSKYARRSEFSTEYAELTRSWLTLELRSRVLGETAEEVRAAHRTALRFAAVMRALASRDLALGESKTLFERPLVLPGSWRRPRRPAPSTQSGAGGGAAAAAVPRTAWAWPSRALLDLRGRRARHAAKAALTHGHPGGAAAPAGGPEEWDRDRAQAAVDAQLLRRIAVKATILHDSGTFKGDFAKEFAGSLEAKLSATEKSAFATFRRGHSMSDFIDLVTDLEDEVGAKLVTANELCRMLRIFEQDQEEVLPTAQLPQFKDRPAIRALGWGDLMVVREELVGYEAGEISHIENALAGESSSREHDRRHRTEVLVEDETTTEKFTENQFATTDRFEIQAESARTIATDFALEAGVNTSGKYGLTQVDTSVSAEISRSTDEST